MSQRRTVLQMQHFSPLQIHCEWLDAQEKAGIDDDSIARADRV